MFFDIIGGVSVSTGILGLLAACGGFLVDLLNHLGKTINADYGYAAAA